MNKRFLVFLWAIFVVYISSADVIINQDLKRGDFDRKSILEISNSKLMDVNIRDSHLENSIIKNLKMTRGIIAGSDFSYAQISNCVFDDIWPTYWGAKAKFQNARFHDVHFINTDLAGIDFSGSSFTEVIFENCNFQQQFPGMEDVIRNFKNCTFHEVRFINCNLSCNYFVDCTFEKVDMARSYQYGGFLLLNTTIVDGTYAPPEKEQRRTQSGSFNNPKG